jgi:hypothetical protein
MKGKPHIRTHMFVEAASLREDHHGQPYCAACGLPKANASHDLPDNPGRDGDQRWVGERTTP